MFRTEGVSVTLDAKDVLSTSILQSTTKHLSDTIEWSENRDYEWASNFQLFELIFRISNHSYALAQLLILALFEDYRQYPSDLRELQTPPEQGQQHEPERTDSRDGLRHHQTRLLDARDKTGGRLHRRTAEVVVRLM